MKTLKVFVLIAIVATAAIAASAQQVTEFDVNGLKVIVKVRPNTATVAAGMFVRGGVRNQTEKNIGIESFALKAASEGSRSFPRADLRRELARTGATIGAASNRDYSVMALTSTREHFDRSWNAFADLLINPTFLPADVESVRAGILTGLRGISDSPESFLAVRRDESIFKGHPYSLEPDGTIDTVTSMKPSELAAYHKQLMTTSQLLLVVVGDVDVNDLKARVTASLGALPRGTYKDTPMPAADFSKASLDIATRQIPTNYVEGLFAAPKVGDGDYYALRVATSILSGRVFQEVRVKNNLSYAPEASLESFRSNYGRLSVSTTNPNRAVRLMLDEVNKLKAGEVTQDDIEETSSFFLTRHYMTMESNSAQAADLALYELIGGGWQRSQQFMDQIRKVSTSDVVAAAKKYMTNFRFVIVGDPNSIDRKVFVP